MKHRRLRLLASAWLLTSCKAPDAETVVPPPQVRCVAASTRMLGDGVVLRGPVVAAPDRSATLSAQVPGRLTRLLVREGDDVTRGALIAEVEAQPTRDGSDRAEAVLAEAVAARDAARSEAEHEATLVERGIASKRSLEALRAAQTSAEAAVAAASAQAHAARESLSKTAIRAPMEGAIVHLQRRQGELVDGTQATPICDVVDMSALEVEAPAVPADLVRLERGQHARVRFDTLAGLELPAAVRSVGRAVGANGMGEVWLALELGDTKPPIGVLGTVSIEVSSPRDVVTVPTVAVRNAGGEGVEVVMCVNGVAKVRQVQAGRRQDDWVEVLSGLKSGERVAVDEVTGLEDGMAIDVAAEAP